MEKKKFDLNSLIGFVLIGVVLIWMLYNSKQKEAEKVTDNAPQQTEQVSQKDTTNEAQKNQDTTTTAVAQTTAPDSTKTISNPNLGAFAYSASLPSAKKNTTVLENDVLKLVISNKGGQVVEAKLKNFKTYDSLPVYLIKKNNAALDLSFTTTDNRKLNTKDLYFEPSLSTKGKDQVLSMKLKVAANKYLEYRYELKPGQYMMDFAIRSKGLNNVFNSNPDISLHWQLKGYRNSKSASYENRYSVLEWEYEGDKTSDSRSGTDTDKDISWLAFRQHFFTSILLTDKPFDKANFEVKNLVENEEVDTVFTKNFTADIPLKLQNGELNQNLNLYYGPTDYKVLSKYDRGLDEIVPLGWGIFGWINKFAIIPFFNFLLSFLPAGFAIIFLTICVKILLSPVQYKQFLSQAKMKVLRPEMNEINEKYKDNSVKKQQETMKLQSKAGASPLSGCLPGLLQIPVFYALFSFFPSALELRHTSFLWVNDLSSYDVVAQLPFHIPLYGNHVSLFPILASIAIFFYMTLTTGQSMQQSQPGMPNMKFIMYLSPLFMLVFFNNYASGLSLYYFTSNTISIAIVLIIKHYIIDEEKIHAKIQENKKKPPKKKGKFGRKMQEMMEEAERQKNAKH